MPANDIILEGHEVRLQACERVINAVASHAEADGLRFQMISDQIEALGKGLTDSINGLGKRVDDLAVESAEHHKYFKQLEAERENAIRDAKERAKRRRWMKRATIAAVGAILTAVAEAAGEDVWTWLASLLKHPFFW